jgi:hypothetical protein
VRCVTSCKQHASCCADPTPDTTLAVELSLPHNTIFNVSLACRCLSDCVTFRAVFLPCEVPVRILGVYPDSVQPVQSNACRASLAVRAVPGEVRALTFCRTLQRLSYFFCLCLLSILHTSGLLCKVCYRRLPAIGFCSLFNDAFQ